MNISSIFIDRPIGSVLISLGIAFAGILAFKLMPVSSLPHADVPIIMVQAQIAGTSPEIMASSVATPLERTFSRIDGITTMTSNSTFGSTEIILEFDLSRDADAAAEDVQSAIDAALQDLPSNMISQPSYLKVNPADSPIMVIALTSETIKIEDLYDTAYSILQQKILQIEGVGQVRVVGSSLPAIRIEANPTKLSQYGISLTQIDNLINDTHVNLAKGRINNHNTRYEIVTNDQLFKPEEYESLIIKNDNENIIRISDVAKVVRAAQNTNNAGSLNGHPAILLVIYKQPNGSIIEINQTIANSLNEFKKIIPSGITFTKLLDKSIIMNISLKNVEMTLVFSILFVLLVIFIFLGNVRSTFIPAIALILSMLGTFAIIQLLGFSLNMLSLMAITISTGLIIDDAIVVLEKISRYIEQGLEPKLASLKGSAEIDFTITSISISLIAVFIPLLFMTGIIGRLFREFAITLSIAILISLFLSLTITPAMCAHILKPRGQKIDSSFVHSILVRVKNGYKTSLSWSLDHSNFMLFVFLATVALNAYLIFIIPKGFFPQQDTGNIIGSLIADENVSFQKLNNIFPKIVAIIKEDPAVSCVVGSITSNTVSTSLIHIELKKLKVRKVSADVVMARLRKKLAQIPEVSIYMQSVQDLVIGGRLANAQYQYTITTDSLESVNKYAPIIQSKLEQIPDIIDLNSDQGNHARQVYIKIDYDKASSLGVTTESIDQILYAAFGQKPIATMYKVHNQYYVVLVLSSEYTQNPDTLNNIYVPSSKNGLIALSSFAQFIESSSFF